LLGAESLPKVFYEGLKTFSRREFPRFKTRNEALDWLVKRRSVIIMTFRFYWSTPNVVKSTDAGIWQMCLSFIAKAALCLVMKRCFASIVPANLDDDNVTHGATA